MRLIRNNGTLGILLLASLMGCGGVESAPVRAKQFIRGNAQSSSTVDAHEVDSNGQAVSESNPDSQATADSSGDYSVEVAVRAGATANFVVESTLGSVRRACIIESTFTASADVVAEPMTVETTFEADVFVNALVRGELCDGCNAATVFDWVGEQAAAAHAAAPSTMALDASTDVSATAVTAYHAALVTTATSGATSVDAAEAAHVAARTERASALDAATTQSQIDAAEASYSAAVKAAYTGAGVTLDERSASAQAATEAATSRIDANSSLSASMEAALRSDAELGRAAHVTAAVEAHASDAGASAVTLDAARASLEASLASAATAGVTASAQIDAAWDTYRMAVEGSIRSALSVPQQLAFDGAVTAVASGSTTTHAALDASVASNASVSAWIMPVLTFLSSSSTQTDALTSAGVPSIKADAIISIVLALEFAAG